MRSGVYCVLTCLCCLACPFLWKQGTQGFRLEKIQMTLPFHAAWEAKTPPSIDLPTICQGPFRYLAKGSQCYVFQDGSGDYVLKIFRSDLLKNRTRRWLRAFYAKYFHPQKETPTTLFKEKIEKTMTASWLAYEAAPEFTGVVYIHLNLTEGASLPTVTLYDHLGRAYLLPLHSVRFVIQKKGERMSHFFQRCQQQPDQIQAFLRSFLDLLSQRVQKQLVNTDHNISPNFGCSGTHALEIDFGNYIYSDALAAPHLQKTEFHRFIEALHHWMSRHAPEWCAYFKHQALHMEQETWPTDSPNSECVCVPH